MATIRCLGEAALAGGADDWFRPPEVTSARHRIRDLSLVRYPDLGVGARDRLWAQIRARRRPPETRQAAPGPRGHAAYASHTCGTPPRAPCLRRQARLPPPPIRLLPRRDAPPVARLLRHARDHRGGATALVLSPTSERSATAIRTIKSMFQAPSRRRGQIATTQSPARRPSDERFAMNALVGGPAGCTIAIHDSRRAQADRPPHASWRCRGLLRSASRASQWPKDQRTVFSIH